MSMYLKYGSLTFDPGECSFSMSRPVQFVNGIARSYLEIWDLTGRIQEDDTAAVGARIAEIEAGFAIQGQDIGLYLSSDNSATEHLLLSSTCIGGTRVVQRPSFPEGRRAEYSTFRNWTARVEGEVLDTTIHLIDWRERMSFSGGGSKFVHLEPLNGLPQKQTVKQAIVFCATQQGEATGLQRWPTVPPPRWPHALHRDLSSVTTELPERLGAPGRAQYLHYKITWNYVFESAEPLIGAPGAWPE